MRGKITAWNSGEEMTPAIVTASHQWQLPTKPRVRVQHPYWVLDCTETVGEEYRVKGATRGWLPRPPGQFHLYPPQTIYWDSCYGAPHGVECYSIMFRGGSQLGFDALLQEGFYAMIIDPSGRLKALLEQIVEITPHESDVGFPGVQAALWQIAGLLRQCRKTGVRQYTVPEATSETREPGLVEMVDRYLHQHLSDRVRLEDLAHELNLSSSAISHYYKKAKGQSPIASLIEMRIQIAKVLILQGNPLKAVASQTGFCDAFQLSRIFTKHTGISPREFSKRASQGRFE
jgi:AraC-like DNA-binding protein